MHIRATLNANASELCATALTEGVNKCSTAAYFFSQAVIISHCNWLHVHVTALTIHDIFTLSVASKRIPYSKKLLQIGEKYDLRRENFRWLLAFAVPKDAMPPNFAEKTFANSYKTAKFTKVFSFESFPLYCRLEYSNSQLPVNFTVWSILTQSIHVTAFLRLWS